MTEPSTTCDGCSASISNGLRLCSRCRARVLVDLEFLPTYYANLTRWKPGRAGAGRSVPGSREPTGAAPRAGGMGDDRVARALDEAARTVILYADRLHLEKGVPVCVIDDDPTAEAGRVAVDRVAASCGMLAAHLTVVAGLEWAGVLCRKVVMVEGRLRKMNEQLVPGWYAGICGHRIDQDTVCTAPSYVVPGLTWITCPSCGKTSAARDHVETVLSEAQDWIASARQVAAAVVAMTDTETSVPRLYERIRKWCTRGRLTSYRALDDDGDPVGPHRVRLGDVVDLVRHEGETHARSTTVAS